VIPGGGQVWLDDQVLACVHSDLIAALFDAELLLSASQNGAKRDAAAGRHAHLIASSPVARAAVAGKSSAKPDSKSSNKKKAVGVRIAEGVGGGDLSDRGDSAEVCADVPTPFGAVEARLMAECRKNNAWKAILNLQIVKYRKTPQDKLLALQNVENYLKAADADVASLSTLLQPERV
jgi:hypothetical protein